MTQPPSIHEESQAFDDRMRQRIANGHIPDLRRALPTLWFYNNPWRHPYFVDKVIGEYYRFVKANLPFAGARVLEIGSGPGHITLELARDGYHVTGLELSPYSVEVARGFAADNPYTDGFGSVEYVCADFLTWESDQTYDAIYFLLSLHHFDDLDTILTRCKQRLNPGGVFIAVEPARDWLTQAEMSVAALIRLLLANYGGWHENLSAPTTQADLSALVRDLLDEYREARDKSESLQSPHDNASHASAMLESLRTHFHETAYQESFTFLPRMIGGIRGQDEAQIMRTADLLVLFDEFFVAQGILQPGVYCFAGRLPV
ncbi:MAG: class I SAM-dependent methyltransferase [Chloroflexota bacterium]|nr:class I SAM-dependent methyltransferase [Chloroflexota bacterium]